MYILLTCFEIAGADKVFYPGEAKIKDQKVIVTSKNAFKVSLLGIEIEKLHISDTCTLLAGMVTNEMYCCEKAVFCANTTNIKQ